MTRILAITLVALTVGLVAGYLYRPDNMGGIKWENP